MKNLDRFKERELRKVYKTIPNMKSRTFGDFTDMMGYWCDRCPKRSLKDKRGEKL
jgi:hypothetical protein